MKYSAKMRRGTIQCQDDVGSCERAVCECDLQFARESGSCEFRLNLEGPFWNENHFWQYKLKFWWFFCLKWLMSSFGTKSIGAQSWTRTSLAKRAAGRAVSMVVAASTSLVSTFSSTRQSTAAPKTAKSSRWARVTSTRHPCIARNYSAGNCCVIKIFL